MLHGEFNFPHFGLDFLRHISTDTAGDFSVLGANQIKSAIITPYLLLYIACHKLKCTQLCLARIFLSPPGKRAANHVYCYFQANSVVLGCRESSVHQLCSLEDTVLFIATWLASSSSKNSSSSNSSRNISLQLNT